jgi:hypothetical protein
MDDLNSVRRQCEYLIEQDRKRKAWITSVISGAITATVILLIQKWLK